MEATSMNMSDPDYNGAYYHLLAVIGRLGGGQAAADAFDHGLFEAREYLHAHVHPSAVDNCERCKLRTMAEAEKARWIYCVCQRTNVRVGRCPHCGADLCPRCEEHPRHRNAQTCDGCWEVVHRLAWFARNAEGRRILASALREADAKLEARRPERTTSPGADVAVCTCTHNELLHVGHRGVCDACVCDAFRDRTK